MDLFISFFMVLWCKCAVFDWESSDIFLSYFVIIRCIFSDFVTFAIIWRICICFIHCINALFAIITRIYRYFRLWLTEKLVISKTIFHLTSPIIQLLIALILVVFINTILTTIPIHSLTRSPSNPPITSQNTSNLILFLHKQTTQFLYFFITHLKLHPNPIIHHFILLISTFLK